MFQNSLIGILVATNYIKMPLETEISRRITADSSVLLQPLIPEKQVSSYHLYLKIK